MIYLVHLSMGINPGKSEAICPPPFNSSSGGNKYCKSDINGMFFSGPEVIRKKLCSTQLSIKFIMLMNVKMPTMILTFISMVNKTSESLNARKVYIIQHFSFFEQLKFHAQLC